MCENNNYSGSSKVALKNLLSAVRNGDQEAFCHLSVQYQPLMSSLTSHYSSLVSAEDLEEMRADALSALYDAALSYDDEQEDVEFGLYAKICIKNRLATSYRACARRAKLRIVGIDKEPYGDDGENEDDTVVPYVDDDPLKSVVERESFELLRKRINDALSDYESRIWWLYMSGMSARDVALYLDGGGDIAKAEKSVTNALYRIRQKLRRVLS